MRISQLCSLLGRRCLEVQQNDNFKLQDSGSREDLAGTGANRDIDPTHGRCDLLPAHILYNYIVRSDMVNEMHRAGIRVYTVLALGKLFRYLDALDTNILYDVLDCLVHQNFIIHNSDYIDTEENWKGMLKLHGFAQMCMDLSVHYKNGALKYAERNWEKGLPIHSFIDSAIRHLCKEILGWTDEPHLIACAWNVVGALYTLETYPWLQDLPNQKEKREENKNGNKAEKEQQ